MKPINTRLLVLILVGLIGAVALGVYSFKFNEDEEEYEKADQALQRKQQANTPKLTETVQVVDVQENGKIIITVQGKQISLRLAGVNITPPLPNKELNFIRSKVNNQQAELFTLKPGSEAQTTDCTGFLWVNGNNINWGFIRYGLATIDESTAGDYLAELKSAQSQAQKERKGIWKNR